MSVYNPEMLIFLDETGADRRNILRKYGYSMRGKPAQKHTLLVGGERVSVIASINGLLGIDVIKGTVDGDRFYDYTVRSKAVSPSSSHALYCSIHHIEGIASMIEEVGTLVHFLPPYSPDFNPIERIGYGRDENSGSLYG